LKLADFDTGEYEDEYGRDMCLKTPCDDDVSGDENITKAEKRRKYRKLLRRRGNDHVMKKIENISPSWSNWLFGKVMSNPASILYWTWFFYEFPFVRGFLRILRKQFN